MLFPAARSNANRRCTDPSKLFFAPRRAAQGVSSSFFSMPAIPARTMGWRLLLIILCATFSAAYVPGDFLIRCGGKWLLVPLSAQFSKELELSYHNRTVDILAGCRRGHVIKGCRLSCFCLLIVSPINGAIVGVVGNFMSITERTKTYQGAAFDLTNVVTVSFVRSSRHFTPISPHFAYLMLRTACNCER